jgi:PKD repeat protein
LCYCVDMSAVAPRTNLRKVLLVVFGILTIVAVVGWKHGVARAEEAVYQYNIAGSIPLVRQTDPRWGGIEMKGIINQSTNTTKTYAECGCFLATLATMLNHYVPLIFTGTTPRFPVRVLGHNNTVVNSLEWSPIAVDHYLRCGSAPIGSTNTLTTDPCDTAPNTNWGYKPSSTDCGVMPYPWALENIALPVSVDTGGGGIIHGPTGISFTAKHTPGGLSSKDIADIIERLRQGHPTLVTLHNFDFKSREFINTYHSVIVVAYRADEKHLIIIDPAGEDNFFTGQPELEDPYYSRDMKYEGWLQDVENIMTIEPTHEGATHLAFIDDPAPITFAMTSPDGRRTGYNPSTGSYDTSDSNTSLFDFGSDTDLFSTDAVDTHVKGMEVLKPTDGVWRSEIIGTGNGPYRVDVAKIVSSDTQVATTLSGTISTGQVIKQEVEYHNNQAPVTRSVDNFTPEAVPGDSRSARTGQSLTFDGKRSWDADGSIVAWSWDFGDGQTANGSRQSHAYTTQGTHTVTLTVTDNQGATSSKQLQVAVTPAPTINVKRVSISSEDLQGNNGSGITTSTTGWSEQNERWIETVSASSDGRYTAFQSLASNLVAGDTNDVADIFLRDTQTNATTRISLDENGQQLSRPSGMPRISADGSFVIFRSGGNVYIWSRQTDKTELVNINSTGTAVSDSTNTVPGGVSPDGRYIVFSTQAGLDPTDTDGLSSVYIRDRVAGKTMWVSRGNERSPYGAWDPTISDDGSKVVYTSYDNVTSQNDQIYEYNSADNSTKQISTTTAGIPSQGVSDHADITPDGHYVVFDNNDLDPSLINKSRVIVKNLQTGEAKGVPGSVNVDNGNLIARPHISNDGRSVLVMMQTLLPLGNVFGKNGFGVYDRTTGIMKHVDLTQAGTLLDQGNSSYADISGDGRYVAYSTYGSNVVPFDTNGAPDVFVRDMQTDVPPTADISGPYAGWATNGSDGLIVTFDGSASVDVAKAPLKYIWDFGDGSPAVTTTTKTTTHGYQTAGSYTATLTVNNGETQSTPATAQVTVYPQPDITPVITPACSDPSGAIVITGTGTIPFTARQGWNLMNGPLPATQNALFSDWGQRFDYTAKPPDYNYTIKTTIPSWLSAGAHTISDATITVPCPTVSNEPPLPDSGGNYTIAANVPLTFDGSHSLDKENDPLTYAWNFGDGTTGSTAQPQHTYAQPGTYYVSLAVNDGHTLVHASAGHGYSKVIVTQPTASVKISADSTHLSVPEGSTIHASGSFTAPAGTAVNLSSSSGTVSIVNPGQWEWIGVANDGPSSQTVTITATGGGSADSVQLTIDSQNVAPTIDTWEVGTTGIACGAGSDVNFHLAAHDPAGAADPLTTTVDWGDGSTSQFTGGELSIKHNYKPGSYIATVTVSDDDGGSNSSSTAPGQINLQYRVSGFLQPINSDNSSIFKLGSTIPVKISVVDCTGLPVSNLAPRVGLSLSGSSDGNVNEVVSSSSADTGSTMRWNGDSYIFNLSTKQSQFNTGADLVPGQYILNISGKNVQPKQISFGLTR